MLGDGDVAGARRQFHDGGEAEAIAGRILGGSCHRDPRTVSRRISVWGDERGTSAERLVVVLHPHEQRADVPLGLAYALQLQGDADLHLVLPAEHAEPTRKRLAHLVTPIRLWSIDGADLQELVVPARHEVLRSTQRDKTLVVEDHALGSGEGWIASLVEWAESAGLEPAHRRSYRSWHYKGRQLLKAQWSGELLVLTAGIDYSSHRVGVPMAVARGIQAPLSPDDDAALRAAIADGINRRTDGSDTENLEHILQAELRKPAGVAALGLAAPVLREVPANRPGSRRAYIDLAGVDADGRIHIVETKLGVDAMLGLQGLDYWVWAKANRPLLVELMRSHGHAVGDEPELQLDFLIGSKRGDRSALDLRYLAPQLEAFPSEVRWRIGHVDGWSEDDADISITWEKVKSYPPVDGHRPRYALRVGAHLAERAAAEGNLSRRMFFKNSDLAAEPAALPLLAELRGRGLLHRYVDHVRSSQLFAVNLLGGLPDDEALAVAQQADPQMAVVHETRFEYVDPADHLHETTRPGGHQTQADVAFLGSDAAGAPRIVLVEVKLTEDDFGRCSGYQNKDIDDIAVCRSIGGFGSEPDRCFSLRNHGKGGRRSYDLYVTGATHGAGCTFRTSLNQPMRYAALASALVAAGDFAAATVALCAPDEHRVIWRRWDEAKAVLTPRGEVRFADLPASTVRTVRQPVVAQRLEARYVVGAPTGGSAQTAAPPRVSVLQPVPSASARRPSVLEPVRRPAAASSVGSIPIPNWRLPLRVNDPEAARSAVKSMRWTGVGQATTFADVLEAALDHGWISCRDFVRHSQWCDCGRHPARQAAEPAARRAAREMYGFVPDRLLHPNGSRLDAAQFAKLTDYRTQLDGTVRG